MASNAELAQLFDRMGQLLELLGANRFKVVAYQRAVRAIEGRTDQLADLVNTDDPDDLSKLKKIDGIGEGIAMKIAEYVTTGQVEEYQELLDQVPPQLPEVLDVPGLGPKTVAMFWKQAGIESLEDLREKLKGDELTELEGIGKKKLENIRKNLAFVDQAGQRVRIGEAMDVAQWIVSEMQSLDGVKTIDYAGSLRRGKETIGDVDIIVAASEDNAEAIGDHFANLDRVTDVLVKGKTKTSVRIDDAIQADLRIIQPNQFGAALLYFTGSKEHNVRLRERALKMGYSLNEYGLWNKDDEDDLQAGKTENAIYQKLELKWIPPELREDRGEIDLADKDKLPDLVEFDDIQCELHAHTTASDGKWSIEDLAQAAADRGFHTVAVTDHSVSQVQASGLDAKRLEKHAEAVREVAKKMSKTIRILAGTEVDILSDGSLDYDAELLASLDLVVASPHVALSQDAGKATRRLITAIESGRIDILGHPTGRLIGKREGLSPDMNKVIDAAKANDVALEINANHMRLDLRDTHAHAALEKGAKLAVNTDAHGPAHLDMLRFGVLTARRAGACRSDIINCFNKGDLTRWLNRRG